MQWYRCHRSVNLLTRALWNATPSLSLFCSSVINKAAGSHLQCCEQCLVFFNQTVSLLKESFPPTTTYLGLSPEELDPFWVNVFLGYMKLFPFTPFSLFLGEHMRKGGLVWKTFICSLEAHQSVQQPWGGVCDCVGARYVP